MEKRLKIELIEAKNLKSIKYEKLDLNGCTILVTGRNNSGKTTVLKALIDRFHSKTPELILRKQGSLTDISDSGYYKMVLTDGAIIEWKFAKTERFIYTTKEGLKQTQGVLSAISKKYFGVDFEIDKFLTLSAKKQSSELQRLLGVDISEIEERYGKAYKERSLANEKLRDLRGQKVEKPEEVEKPNIEELKQILIDLVQSEIDKNTVITKENEKLRLEWIDKVAKHSNEVNEHNAKLKSDWKLANENHIVEITKYNDYQKELKEKKESIINIQLEIDLLLKDSNLEQFYDFKSSDRYIKGLKDGKESKAIKSIEEPEYKQVKQIPEPTYTPLFSNKEEQQRIQTDIENANTQLRKYDAYERDLSDYNNWLQKGKVAKTKAEELDKLVKSIDAEKVAKIKQAKIPEDFAFSPDGLTYKGLPLSSNQISSSGRYIAGLKLGALGLGLIKTLHFDASFLDRPNLEKVKEWANENDLQLLIERPDFEGSEFKYEFI